MGNGQTTETANKSGVAGGHDTLVAPERPDSLTARYESCTFIFRLAETGDWPCQDPRKKILYEGCGSVAEVNRGWPSLASDRTRPR